MSGNHNAISKFPRAKYTASPVDHRKCEKKPKSYYAKNPFMFFDFTGPTAFWALGESKLCQQTKTQFENDEYASNLDDFPNLAGKSLNFPNLTGKFLNFQNPSHFKFAVSCRLEIVPVRS